MSTPGELVKPAARLLAELMAQGEVDSAGAFTLDREQARQKLQRFQLTNPARYVLELVQAAVLKGARHIEFLIDADDLHLRCDGEPFTAADFEQVYGALFLKAPETQAQARRHLALGLCTALALDPKVVVIYSGDRQSGAFLELRPGQPDRYGTRAPAPEDGPHTTHIHVRQRMRLQLLKRYFEDRGGTLAEELLLRKRCRHATVDISLDGQVISHGHEIMNAPWAQQFADENITGVVGAQYSLSGSNPVSSGRVPAPSSLVLVKNGVWLETFYPELLLPGSAALADCPTLRQDISHERVVQDEQYQRVVNTVLAHQLARLAAECAQESTAREQDRRPLLRWLLALLVQRLGSVAALLRWVDLTVPQLGNGALPPNYPEQVPGAAGLVHLPILFTAAGTWVNLVQLIADISEYGSVAISEVKSPAPDPERPLVLYFENPRDSTPWLSALACPVVSRTEVLKKVATTWTNHRAWQRRKMPAKLPNNDYLARAPISGAKVRGEVGLVTPAFIAEPWPVLERLPYATEERGTRLLLIRQGCLLSEKSFLWPLPNLVIVLEADFTPNDLFSDVVGDAILAEALAAAFQAMVALVPALTVTPLVQGLEPVRARMMRGLVGFLPSPQAQTGTMARAGVEQDVATAATKVVIDKSWLWSYLREWPLLPHLQKGLLSLTDVYSFAEGYGCIPCFTVPASVNLPRGNDLREQFRRDLADPELDPAVWQVAHSRVPTPVRSPQPPKLVVCLSGTEPDFNLALCEQLGPLYADMEPWLNALQVEQRRQRAAAAQAAPLALTAPPRQLTRQRVVDPNSRPLSVDKLRAELRKYGKVLYAPLNSGAITWSHPSRSVVGISDPASWKVLCGLFGADNLLHVSAVESPKYSFPIDSVQAAYVPPATPSPASKAVAHLPTQPQAAHIMAPPQAPPPPSPAEQLRAQVEAELRRLEPIGGKLLSQVNLARLQIGPSSTSAAVICDHDHLLINVKHPLCKHAVEHFQTDRTLVFFVASAVYTALNTWMEAVTDADEIEFHRLLCNRAHSQLHRTESTTPPP